VRAGVAGGCCRAQHRQEAILRQGNAKQQMMSRGSAHTMFGRNRG
jgi:hypothetical protein